MKKGTVGGIGGSKKQDRQKEGEGGSDQLENKTEE